MSCWLGTKTHDSGRGDDRTSSDTTAIVAVCRRHPQRLSKKHSYGVRLVRGPFLNLPPHRDHIEDADHFLSIRESRAEEDEGALGRGFLQRCGRPESGFGAGRIQGCTRGGPRAVRQSGLMRTISVDCQSTGTSRILRWSPSWATLFATRRLTWSPAVHRASRSRRPAVRCSATGCSRACVIRTTNVGDLWRSLLEIIDRARPKAVLMENVPDMALDREMFILRSMVEELEQMDYSVEERVVDTWRYGVPQFRQRLILVALQKNTQFRWPEESRRSRSRSGTPSAIYRRSRADGGPRVANTVGLNTQGRARSSNAKCAAASPPRMRTRSSTTSRAQCATTIVKPSRSMTHATKYTDLNQEHQRYRGDIFDDKYNRLNENDLSRTITAHIAKDGYWYIHPRQSRTLTDPRGGPATDVSRRLPLRRASVCSVPSDRQRRPATARLRHWARDPRISGQPPRRGSPHPRDRPGR